MLSDCRITVDFFFIPARNHNFCSILRHNSIHCHFNVVNIYIYQYILVFLHSIQRRFMKRGGTKTLNLKQPFSRLPVSQRVEMIAPMLLKAILKLTKDLLAAHNFTHLCAMHVLPSFCKSEHLKMFSFVKIDIFVQRHWSRCGKNFKLLTRLVCELLIIS